MRQSYVMILLHVTRICLAGAMSGVHAGYIGSSVLCLVGLQMRLGSHYLGGRIDTKQATARPPSG